MTGLVDVVAAPGAVVGGHLLDAPAHEAHLVVGHDRVQRNAGPSVLGGVVAAIDGVRHQLARPFAGVVRHVE